jgi:hypothetical protein
LDNANKIADEITNSLEIAHFIKNIYIENTHSPWNEKGFIKRKRDHLDVKITIWEDNRFLYGRIYRLFLYIYDVLNPHFQYKPQIAPDEYKEPKMKDRHNQIWSIYVDSRVERMGIKTFYDKFLRKNIFIDAEREITWGEADEIFQKLWGKDVYTYPEITYYTYNLDKLMDIHIPGTSDILEKEIKKSLHEPYVQKHIDKMPSATFRNFTKELLNFTAYNCKDIYIEASYFGISVSYQKRVVFEIIPTMENILFLTLLNTESNTYETRIVTEDSNITEVQGYIKEMYNKVSMHSHF